MKKLSVVLLTRNEENNLKECLKSVGDLADEIIVFDEFSEDKTVEVAKLYKASVYKVLHQENFHINKKKALEKASCEWILQLDADERLTESLRSEIRKVLDMNSKDLEDYEHSLKDKELFERHQKLIETREGESGESCGEFMAFYLPRLNLFLGKGLRYGGVYPDGVIRLVKKGSAHFPAKSVHEQIKVNGRIGWLQNALIHTPDNDFKRYLRRNSYYIGLIAKDLKNQKTKKGPAQILNYFIIMPVWWFFLTQIRHKGILDGWRGIIFSFFSALRFPRAYFRYLVK